MLKARKSDKSKPGNIAVRSRTRNLLGLGAVAAVIVFAVCALLAGSFEEKPLMAGIRGGGPAAPILTEPEPQPEPIPVAVPESEPVSVLIQGTVKKGETMSSLLGDVLTPQEIFLLAEECKDVFPLRKIREGRPYTIRTVDGEFHTFEYQIDREERLVIRAETDGLIPVREPIVYDIDTVMVCGTIMTSLYEAAGRIGEAPLLVMRMAEIFGWEVDFVLDVREGDTFKAIVEKRYLEGEFEGYGRIHAAEFLNQGKTHQAFLFENRDGHPEYYDANGRSLRRAFLKTPVEYARISSGFSWNRFHPVKKEWTAHPAVDYAAPEGTPVRTVGDGVVLVAGRNHASGNYLKIRHSSGYETYYLHLSHFARGIRKGTKVHQGQVIGYVGSTGMSTGPHLCFRMKRHGKYVNPRKVMSPASPPVPRKRIEEYRHAIQPLLAQIEATTIPVVGESPVKAAASREEQQDLGRGGP